MKFNTKVIHAGIEPDEATGAIMTPIYQTSTFIQKSPGVHKGFEYARTQNPTRITLENNLAALENGVDAACFGSGMAAIDAILKLLNPGDKVLATQDLYGGSYRIFTKVFAKYDIHFTFADFENPEEIAKMMDEKTKMVWIETPTNPTLQIIDIERVAKIAHENNALLVVDNTFGSPYLQRPIDLGADLVIHSATKYLGGHSDVVLGAVVAKDPKVAEELKFLQNTCGAVPGPQDSFLVLRGIKTLHLRVQRSSENAAKIADFLKNHPKVGKTYYPGLPDHPNHDIAKKQMNGFGGMVSFSLKEDTQEAALAVLENTHVFTLAESLGGVESLIGHPATMTHAAIPKEEREKTGVLDSFIRLSVGVEDATDLIADLEAALDTIP